jgi:Cu-Zn family superoxide dismutase
MWRTIWCAAVLGALAIPAQTLGDDKPRTSPTQGELTKAVAALEPTKDERAAGTVTFVKRGNAVLVTADVSGLEPNTAHGFHVHEFGDCSAPDASSAGGHFNPGTSPHAGPPTRPRHGGDLGNIQSDATGRAHLELTVPDVTIASGKDMILGRAVVVHQKADDFTTQPDGAAGHRVACGVIGAARDTAAGG